MNLESATLILRTSEINISNGDINVNNRNNDVTWNVNLQACLGSMFIKYKRFKICLTSVGGAGQGATLTGNDRGIQFNMEGLQWENQSYNTTTGTLGSNVILAPAFIPATDGWNINFIGEAGFVFIRPPANDVKLRIFITRIASNVLPDTTSFGNMVFCFSIYGINE